MALFFISTALGKLPVTRTARFFAAVCLVALLLPPGAAAAEKISLRYLRGVHVLQQMTPGASWPAVSVPRQVRTHDTTSALLAHRDTAFVLESVSRDLTAAMKTGKYPESGYYAAQALSLLGRHAEAAEAMKTYLAKAPFREADYLFLVRELYAAADYSGTLAQAQAWEARSHATDNLCSEERLAYTWGSLQAMRRYREAMEEVLSDPCASWRGQVFFAKSSLDLGDAEGAQARIEAAIKIFPDKRPEIENLWDRLAASALYP
ncbi:exported hypothetical protein [uncultured delta proteobacterium]|uniref:Tetratricopeptide repeat protein n=1 Tax=uncultured delta proteobacterium TaxID=34034 RepID=A0A212JLI7_9DELT|nr:exported hypothetical protein [uncultured delta proteobacterium]